MSEIELETCFIRCIDKDKEIITQLYNLIEEAESLHAACNVAKTGRMIAGVAGTIALCAAPFTGGASLLISGAIASIGGAATNLITEKVDRGKSNHIISRIQSIVSSRDNFISQLERELQLFDKLVEHLVENGIEEQSAIYTILECVAKKSIKLRYALKDSSTLHELVIKGRAMQLIKISIDTIRATPEAARVVKVAFAGQLQLINSVFGIGSKSAANLLKTASKGLGIASVAVSVVEVGLLIRDWVSSHPTVKTIENTIEQLRKEIEDFQKFVQAINFMKEQISLSTIENPPISSNQQFNQRSTSGSNRSSQNQQQSTSGSNALSQDQQRSTSGRNTSSQNQQQSTCGSNTSNSPNGEEPPNRLPRKPNSHESDDFDLPEASVRVYGRNKDYLYVYRDFTAQLLAYATLTRNIRNPITNERNRDPTRFPSFESSRGPNARVEYLRTEVTSRHIGRGEDTSANRTLADLVSQRGLTLIIDGHHYVDDARHILPCILGGPMEHFNLYSQNPCTNRGFWRSEETLFMRWLHCTGGNRTIDFEARFIYESDESTRPIEIIFLVKFKIDNRLATTQEVENCLGKGQNGEIKPIYYDVLQNSPPNQKPKAVSRLYRR